jgi:thioredoxin-related protein/YHS domain-containing protein
MSRLAVISWLFLSFACGSAFAEGEIRWAPDLATARRAAEQYQVPVLVHFYGDNCLPCKTLEQRVYNQDSVIKTLNKYFICVRVNASQDRAVAAEFQVHSWPTDVFISPSGQVLYQAVSKQDIGGYMDVLQNVAVMNRDRNSMLAADRSQPQTATPNPLAANTSLGQSATPANALPPKSQPSNPSPSRPDYAAPPAIAASTPATQFQVAPPARPAMMNSQAGLPPLPAHLATKPLGSDGLGGSSVSQQISQQANMPIVASNNTPRAPQNARQQIDTGAVGSLVSNPYYSASSEPDSESLVCGPDGKCGPTPGTPNNPLNPQLDAVASAGPHYPSLPSATAPIAPTFQPKSALLVSSTIVSKSNATEPPASERTAGGGDLNAAQTAGLTIEAVAYSGFCPIALVTTGQKIPGLATNAVRHRGRTYLLASPEAVKQFMQAPDRYSPVLSGYDPMIFLLEGNLVEGTLEYALHDPTSGMVVLFANAETQQQFKADPARHTKALTHILNAANK